MGLWTRPLVITVLLCTACDESSPVEGCEDSPWTYANTGDPFLRTWCTPCHHSELPDDTRLDGTEDVNLDGFTNVATLLDRIEARALGDTPTMPPSGGPTDAELTQLTEWIQCGAPE